MKCFLTIKYWWYMISSSCHVTVNAASGARNCSCLLDLSLNFFKQTNTNKWDNPEVGFHFLCSGVHFPTGGSQCGVPIVWPQNYLTVNCVERPRLGFHFRFRNTGRCHLPRGRGEKETSWPSAVSVFTTTGLLLRLATLLFFLFLFLSFISSLLGVCGETVLRFIFFFFKGGARDGSQSQPS